MASVRLHAHSLQSLIRSNSAKRDIRGTQWVQMRVRLLYHDDKGLAVVSGHGVLGRVEVDDLPHQARPTRQLVGVEFQDMGCLLTSPGGERCLLLANHLPPFLVAISQSSRGNASVVRVGIRVKGSAEQRSDAFLKVLSTTSTISSIHAWGMRCLFLSKQALAWWPLVGVWMTFR